MKVRFHPEAEAELAAARVWYGIQREGLDAALMSRIDEALKHSRMKSSSSQCSIRGVIR